MLAQRPPMGWNSWNTFGENISEELIMGIADAMVEKGLRDAGYEYIVIDDCWSLRERGEDGRLVADPKKIPPRYEIPCGLHSLQRHEIRNVFLRRNSDLRGLSVKL